MLCLKIRSSVGTVLPKEAFNQSERGRDESVLKPGRKEGKKEVGIPSESMKLNLQGVAQGRIPKSYLTPEILQR